MTWVYIASGVVIPVLGWIIRLAYLSWQRNRQHKREREAERERGDKYKREAEIHAGPRRSKSDIIRWMRDRAK